MNLIPLIVSALLILTACAPETRDIPVTGSNETGTSVVENPLAGISTPAHPTLTTTSLALTLVHPLVTSPTREFADAEEITFASGSTAAFVTGSLPTSGSDRYMLRAFAGQMMRMDLSFSESRAILVV